MTTTPTAFPQLGSSTPGYAIVAFDVGGTEIKSALIDPDGIFRDVRRTPTPHDSADPAGVLVARLAELLDDYRAANPNLEIRTVGLSVPGIVDERAGTGVFSSNMGWLNVPIYRLAVDAFKALVVLVHDTRAGAEAERQLGAARGFNDVVVAVIGTGVAGAVIANGEPITGGGYAAELGHATIDLNGEACSCGSRGCLETIASAGAIARRYAARTGKEVAGAKAVLEASAAGDAVAQAVWDDAINALVTHFAQLTAIVAPEAIVISGGLAESGDALFVPLTEKLGNVLSYHRRPQLLRGQLGGNAGLIGTALAAREHDEFVYGEVR